VTPAETVRDRLVVEAELSGFRAHGLHVLVGDDVAEHRWSADVRREVHSVAKGVCALAAGIAADEGLLSLDEPVAAWLPGVGPDDLGDGVDRVTLRHLLSMTSGVDLPWTPTLMTDWPDLALEFVRRPSRGRVFQYSNASTYTAMRVLATRVGDVRAFLEPRLLGPLGLADVGWERCPAGFVTAGDGLALRTEELARLGRLLRDGGVWQGRQLVSAAAVEALHSGWVAAGTGPGYRRYGLGGWDGPGSAWRLHGALGQLVVLVDDAVVTVTADDHDRADTYAAAVVRELEGLRAP
jgi:CubicO group peptidase (beta-lactamase class C family)